MTGIHITDIESAINYWREKSPAPDGISLSLQVRALADVYGRMVFAHQSLVDETCFSKEALEAWMHWYASTPDTPCIAICSTSQGDAFCKGCGRSFEEVQHWTDLHPVQKRAIWRRISQEGVAWRFNRYAERAAERRKPAA